MTTPEEVSGSVSLTTAEQLVCTLTGWHEKVSVYVIGAGVKNLNGSEWRVYAINGTQKTLLGTGIAQGSGNQPVLQGLEGQGDTIALYAANRYGVTTSVKAYMVGWDPSASVSPVQASAQGGVTLTLAEQDVCTLSGGYTDLSMFVNANQDPLANQSLWRLYALLGGVDRVLLQEFQLTQDQSNSSGSFPLVPAPGTMNFSAGASAFVLTAQGRYGNSAKTVTGTVNGNSVQEGAGGGPTPGQFWTIETPIPASATNPLLVQAQATSGPGQPLLIQSQAAATGSNASGGDMTFVMGSDDPPHTTAVPRFFVWGIQTAPDGAAPITDFIDMLSMAWNGSVVISTFGRGNNVIGGGVAAIEISSFTEISMATENQVPINNIIAGPNQVSTFLSYVSTDNTFEQAWALTYAYDHATAGDVSGVYVNATQVAIGTGLHRYFDSAQAGVRRWAVEEGPGNLANVSWYDATGKTAPTGLIRLPFGAGGNLTYIASDDGAGSELLIISRQTAVLTLGNSSERVDHYARNFSPFNMAGTGDASNAQGGFSFFGLSYGQIFGISIDDSMTYVHGQPSTTHNGCKRSLSSTSTDSASAAQTIATIPLVDGVDVVTILEVNVSARDTTGTHNFQSATLKWTYIKNGGVITASTGSIPSPTDSGHSAGAGAMSTLTFTISGGNILVTVTPWTANATAWMVEYTQQVHSQDN